MSLLSRLLLRSVLALGIGLASFLLAVPAVADQARVDVLTLSGDINPTAARYIRRGIDAANDANATVVIIQMDTPGGLDSAMRDIIKAMLASNVPVVVWVGPSGSRAASAGTFITMAAHVAAMAPGTEIGAAHPVGGQGEDIQGTIGEKVLNDAVAYIRSLAELRGRNADWAERAVRESASVHADDAAQLGVVDMVVPDLLSLLRVLDGRSVQMGQRSVTLHTAGAQVHRADMTLIEDFLSTISNPNIAYILLSLSTLALFFELANPGAIFPGVVGGIGIVISLFALGTLPVNWAGLLLIALAFILFLAEVFVTSYGVLAVGAVVALTLGSLILISGNAPSSMQIDRRLIAGVVSGISLFFIFVVQAIVRAQRRQATTGAEGMIGKEGVARTDLMPKGMVFVDGALWQATVDGGEVRVGGPVVVTRVQGLRLWVVAKEAQKEST